LIAEPRLADRRRICSDKRNRQTERHGHAHQPWPGRRRVPPRLLSVGALGSPPVQLVRFSRKGAWRERAKAGCRLIREFKGAARWGGLRLNAFAKDSGSFLRRVRAGNRPSGGGPTSLRLVLAARPPHGWAKNGRGRCARRSSRTETCTLREACWRKRKNNCVHGKPMVGRGRPNRRDDMRPTVLRFTACARDAAHCAGAEKRGVLEGLREGSRSSTRQWFCAMPGPHTRHRHRGEDPRKGELVGARDGRGLQCAGPDNDENAGRQRWRANLLFADAGRRGKVRESARERKSRRTAYRRERGINGGTSIKYCEGPAAAEGVVLKFGRVEGQNTRGRTAPAGDLWWGSGRTSGGTAHG